MAGRAQAGSLDRRITIQVNTPTRGAAGGSVESWGTLLADEPAEFVPLGGTENFTADQVSPQADVLFRIRYNSDVTRKNRVSYGSLFYDIVSTSEDGRAQWLLLYCKVRPT